MSDLTGTIAGLPVIGAESSPQGTAGLVTMPGNERIVVYSTPTCPDCRALKAWLRHLGLSFDEADLTIPAIADEAKRRFGVRIAPITAIGSWFVYGTFQVQRPLIQARIAEVLK
jgi:glutaredoxin